MPVVKGKKPAKARRLDGSVSPTEDLGLAGEESKPYLPPSGVPTGISDSSYVQEAYRGMSNRSRKAVVLRSA